MVNLRRRALFKPVAAGGLPAGYRQVAWINGGGGSTGGKIIFSANNLTLPEEFDVETKVCPISSPNFINLVLGNTDGGFGYTSTKKLYFGSQGGTISLNTDIEFSAKLRKNKDNSELIANGVDTGLHDDIGELRYYGIFGNGDNNNYISDLKVYYFKVFDTEGTLVFDLIPCVDENNVPCFYDLVTKQKAAFNDATKATYGELTT